MQSSKATGLEIFEIGDRFVLNRAAVGNIKNKEDGITIKNV